MIMLTSPQIQLRGYEQVIDKWSHRSGQKMRPKNEEVRIAVKEYPSLTRC
jgi:hypothetical protein